MTKEGERNICVKLVVFIGKWMSSVVIRHTGYLLPGAWMEQLEHTSFINFERKVTSECDPKTCKALRFTEVASLFAQLMHAIPFFLLIVFVYFYSFDFFCCALQDSRFTVFEREFDVKSFSTHLLISLELQVWGEMTHHNHSEDEESDGEDGVYPEEWWTESETTNPFLWFSVLVIHKISRFMKSFCCIRQLLSSSTLLSQWL